LMTVSVSAVEGRPGYLGLWLHDYQELWVSFSAVQCFIFPHWW
jgi:hypothetical protein